MLRFDEKRGVRSSLEKRSSKNKDPPKSLQHYMEKVPASMSPVGRYPTITASKGKPLTLQQACYVKDFLNVLFSIASPQEGRKGKQVSVSGV